MTQIAKTLHPSLTHIGLIYDKCFGMVSYAIKNYAFSAQTF